MDKIDIISNPGDSGPVGGGKINNSFVELVEVLFGQTIWQDNTQEDIKEYLLQLPTNNKTSFLKALQELSARANLVDDSLVSSAFKTYSINKLVAAFASKGDLENLEQNSSLEAFKVIGTSVGKYNDGDTIPAHASNDERWKDIGRKQILPTFILPVANITASINPNTSTEVGTTLTNVLFTASLTQNDGGAANLYKILKDNVEVLNDAVTNTKTETFELSTTPIVFKANVSYDEGTVPKDDNLDPPNSIPNTIVAGNDDSPTLSYRGYRAVFFGNYSSKNATSVDIRANLTKRLENSGNTFNLDTGNTNKIFQLWLPSGKNLTSVIDLDALNANITASYISESLTVNDIGGNPISGTLYTMEQAVPYSSNHRHQITIS